MAQRNAAESQEHEDLIRMMADYFHRQGYTGIQADLPGYPPPTLIQGTPQNHRPDLTCLKNDPAQTPILLEAETGGIADAHTVSQWSLFRSAADNAKGEFHVVVPKVCHGRSGRDAAAAQAQQIGIALDAIWTPL